MRQGRWLAYHLSHYLKQRLSATGHLPLGPLHIHTPAERKSVEQRLRLLVVTPYNSDASSVELN